MIHGDDRFRTINFTFKAALHSVGLALLQCLQFLFSCYVSTSEQTALSVSVIFLKNIYKKGKRTICKYKVKTYIFNHYISNADVIYAFNS